MLKRKVHREQHVLSSAGSEVAALAILILLVAVYYLVRYGPTWVMGADTSLFTSAIHNVLDQGKLIPSGQIYSNGYGFQALAVALTHVGAINLIELQSYGAALMIVWIVLPAWLLYRELTGSRQGAAIATLILFAQSEVLFGITRGTHEKFSRGLMLLCLYLLVRSAYSQRRLSRFVGFIIAFYVSVYALITFNNFFASSFIVALFLGFGLTWVSLKSKRVSDHMLRLKSDRLIYAVVISLILSFLFTFYGYLPARQNIELMDTVVDKSSAMLLGVEAATSLTNPYAVVNSGWLNLPVYFALSVSNWLLLIVSGVVWLWLTLRWLRRRHWPHNGRTFLLWTLFTSFALMSALSIISDISGALTSNLQHRAFPSFAMLAAPLAAKALSDWVPQRETTRRVILLVASIALGTVIITSLLKATNEPLLGNKWLFFIPAELQALGWVDDKLTDKSIWISYDNRLTTAVRIRGDSDWSIKSLRVGAHNYLVSVPNRVLSERFSNPLAPKGDNHITYDNGQSQIFHLRPVTPFQH
jgi:hypothetical protein